MAYTNIPLLTFINNLNLANVQSVSTNKNSQQENFQGENKGFYQPLDCTNYEIFKNEIYKTDENGIRLYKINIKENDNICIVYYDNNIENNNNPNSTLLENGTRSIILDKKTLLPIATQYNKIIYNDDTINFIKNINWNDIEIRKCYEGTMILVFFDNNKWYISTRRCLDAGESKWIKNNSYKELFNEAIENKFKIEDLNKDYCYHFILLHYKNRNIISYQNEFGNIYKEVLLVTVTKKYTLDEINIDDILKIIPIKTPEKLDFKNIEDVTNYLDNINNCDIKNSYISSEGLIFKIYSKDNEVSPTINCKIQTKIYQKMMKLKPNNSNNYQIYLELYIQDKLNDFLPFFIKNNNKIIYRINAAMKNITNEILKLYFITRKKQNEHIYNNLPFQYKKTLYNIHNIYILNKKEKNLQKKNINIHVVYHYLKNIPIDQLKKIFFERLKLLENESNSVFINKNCLNTYTLSISMFSK